MGPETLTPPAPEDKPNQQSNVAPEKTAADKAAEIVGAKKAETIAQEAAAGKKPTPSIELGAMPSKAFVTSAELQQLGTPNPDQAANNLAKAVAESKAQLPELAKEHAADEQAKADRIATAKTTVPHTEDESALDKYSSAAIEQRKTASMDEVVHQMSNWSEKVAELQGKLATATEAEKAKLQDELHSAEAQQSIWEITLHDRYPKEQAAQAIAEPAKRQVELSDDLVAGAVPPEQLTAEVATAKAVESATTAETSIQAPQKELNTLQQDLFATLAEKGVSASMYRTGNEIRADYTDKDGKTIGLETIRELFGNDMPKVAELVGNMEKLAYTNPELFAARETTRERTARLASATLDRLSAQLITKAPDLKSKGLWATARSWFNAGKERATAIFGSFQTKVGEIQRQRSERRVAANFQRFAKNFNLMTPDMIRADQAMVGLTQEIDTKAQEYIQAADTASGLQESIRRLKVMEARLGRMKEVRELEKRRQTFQKQMNMLNGQLNKLRDNYVAVDQQLKQDQALEKQSLQDQLRAKNPERPAYYSQEQEMDVALSTAKPAQPAESPRQPYVGPEIDEPSSTNAPDDTKSPLGTREPYYSQEQEMTDTAANERSETDFDKAQANETAQATTPKRTIPLGPPVAPTTPPATPEAQSGEAA